jgi:MtrB/PioB family decaheme-associated outer membrane protein
VPALEPRINPNYSFTNESFDLNGSYRFNQAARISFGYEREDVDRTLQQIENSTESSYWGALSFSPHATLDFSIRYTDSDRDGDEFQLVPETDPPQNPLIRKYNMADRDRKALTGTLSYTPNAIVGFGLSADYADDEYTESQLGLTDSDYLTFSVDVSITPAPDLRMYAYASHQDIKSTQVGSQTFSTPTWSAETNDSFGTLGFTLNYQPKGGRISVNLDYTYAESFGEIDILNSLDPAVPFPDTETKRHRSELYIDYVMTDALTWRVGWLFEDYDSADWAIDGVNPATIPTVLSLGEKSFSYTVHMPVVSLRYQF